MPHSANRFLAWLAGLGALVLFLASNVRHALLQSNLFDLGIFDQGVYLLSRGLPPHSTTLGFHILGDHAALVLYPLSLLYMIVPHVAWLFLVQGLALAAGVFPMHRLARERGLDEPWARAMAVSYLLYPTVFNVNLFDFHPEVIALPALLWAAWAGLAGRTWPLLAATLLALSCKEVISLTVVAMGLWLWLVGRRRHGAMLAVMGATWFVFSTRWLIPTLTGKGPAAMGRYPYLGSTMEEMIQNALWHPELILSRIFAPEALGYYLLLVAPVLIALHFKEWKALIPALPMLLLNALALPPTQRDLIHQYAIPIFPFLLIAAAGSIKRFEGKRRWLSPRVMTAWSIVAFLALAKYGYFGGLYLSQLSNREAALEAIRQVPADARVLTTSTLAAQLAQRPVIEMTKANTDLSATLARGYDVVLLDMQHPAWASDETFARALADHLRDDPAYDLTFSRDGIMFFQRATGK